MRTIFSLVAALMAVVTATGAEHGRENTEWINARWYNANDNKLPRVLLIGDSICNGYHTNVRDELAGTAYVTMYATSKCVTDRSYLKELKYILEEYDYAVIHFNNGLHSLNTDPKEWEAGLRAALPAELDRLEQCGLVRRALDLPRLRRMVDKWPCDGTEKREIPSYFQYVLESGLMVGKFLQWFETGE